MVSSCKSTIVSHITNATKLVQVGVLHYPRLRMEGLPGSHPLPVDDMGPWRSALHLDFLIHWDLDLLARLIDLLHHAHSRPRGRDTLLCWNGCYDPDQLSGGWYVALAYASGLTSCALKAWISLLLVSFRAHPRVRMPNTSSISDFFIPVFGLCFFIDRSSHVSVHLSFRATIVSPHQALIEGSPALPFGTEIRSLWHWQSVYGESTSRSSSKACPFPSTLLQVVCDYAYAFW